MEIGPSSHVSLHLRIRVADEHEAEFVPFLREAREVYEAPGGIRVRLLRSLSEPNRYIELVEYVDRPTYDRDQVRVGTEPLVMETLARWRTLLAAPPEVEAYEDVTHLLDEGVSAR